VLADRIVSTKTFSIATVPRNFLEFLFQKFRDFVSIKRIVRAKFFLPICLRRAIFMLLDAPGTGKTQ
jgi:hypothetical protein